MVVDMDNVYRWRMMTMMKMMMMIIMMMLLTVPADVLVMIMMMIIMMTLMTILADVLIMIIIMMMIMMIMIMMMTIVAGSRGISDVLITGPSVLENGRQQWVDLACSFTFSSPEYKQLDIKWYFDNEVRERSIREPAYCE